MHDEIGGKKKRVKEKGKRSNDSDNDAEMIIISMNSYTAKTTTSIGLRRNTKNANKYDEVRRSMKKFAFRALDVQMSGRNLLLLSQLLA